MNLRRRLRPLLSWSFLTVLPLLALPAPSAAGPITQNIGNESRNIRPWVGQSFTAEDAFISLAGVYVVDFTFAGAATDFTIDYTLYEGVGSSGTLLASRTFSGLFEGFNGYAHVSFAGIPLVVGSMYSLFVSNDTFEWGVQSAFIADYYTGGTAMLPPTGGAGTPPRDLRFEVLPAAVPEPATLLLLGTGLGAAALRRRRNRVL